MKVSLTQIAKRLKSRSAVGSAQLWLSVAASGFHEDAVEILPDALAAIASQMLNMGAFGHYPFLGVWLSRDGSVSEGILKIGAMGQGAKAVAVIWLASRLTVLSADTAQSVVDAMSWLMPKDVDMTDAVPHLELFVSFVDGLNDKDRQNALKHFAAEYLRFKAMQSGQQAATQVIDPQAEAAKTIAAMAGIQGADRAARRAAEEMMNFAIMQYRSAAKRAKHLRASIMDRSRNFERRKLPRCPGLQEFVKRALVSRASMIVTSQNLATALGQLTEAIASTSAASVAKRLGKGVSIRCPACGGLSDRFLDQQFATAPQARVSAELKNASDSVIVDAGQGSGEPCPKCAGHTFILTFDPAYAGLVRQNATAEVTEPQLKKRCFIATACYGTADCPEVERLRRFRDERLMVTFLGRIVVQTYNLLSPPIASLIAAHPRLASLTRQCVIAPLLKWVDRK